MSIYWAKWVTNPAVITIGLRNEPSHRDQLMWYHFIFPMRAYPFLLLLPSANEVWGKVMFSQACVGHFVRRGEGLHRLDRDHAGQKSPLDRAPSEQRRPSTEISNPAKLATAADGIHPTGMHSCYYYDWICYSDIRIIILNFVLKGKLSVLDEFILINRIQFCCDEWCYIFIKR